MAMAPTVLAVLVGILVDSSRVGDLRSYIDVRFNETNRRIDEMDKKMDRRLTISKRLGGQSCTA